MHQTLCTHHFWDRSKEAGERVFFIFIVHFTVLMASLNRKRCFIYIGSIYFLINATNAIICDSEACPDSGEYRNLFYTVKSNIFIHSFTSIQNKFHILFPHLIPIIQLLQLIHTHFICLRNLNDKKSWKLK